MNVGGGGASGGVGGISGAAGGSSTTPCDAAHSVATVATTTTYVGKANECVRLAVNPSWATVKILLQAQPGTAAYPVPFSFSASCAASGTDSLTANYDEAILKQGANPGCDYFVQFTGGATALKFTYYN